MAPVSLSEVAIFFLCSCHNKDSSSDSSELDSLKIKFHLMCVGHQTLYLLKIFMIHKSRILKQLTLAHCKPI